ncbi:prepilin peptidase [Histophilus somni]|uniref:Prepilin peptidase n=2 Tax=Histophilus somni TaxID=731 RepID=A0AAX2S4M8_HISSO|nr:A24 family peptidase [Histophilus somni]ACA32425.1 peptidase A24A prepilin type IV [Histophilus somni 2336]QEH08415.1 prepilin peptidase [Histophilus somni]QEH13005.1 prepilin peptidase [Histophilus somni]QEH24684.1 prepilin peptidase [Histophilus somni]QEH27490.1 prepilin peptidase [Histophilus somni]
MIYLAYMLFGGLCGLWVYLYVRQFSAQINKQVYSTFCEIFPENAPHLMPMSILRRKKCGHFSMYFLCGGLWCNICLNFPQNIYVGLWLACCGYLIFCLVLVDWLYQLVSQTLCQALFILGLLGAYQGISPLTLEQSLIGSLSGFSVFYLIYIVAKLFYRYEALGRGDYWLMLGLGSFISWTKLPLLIFLACLTGLIYVVFNARDKKTIFIPFAPFLCLSTIIVYLLNFLREDILP